MSVVHCNPKLLKWAREQSGFNSKEVAKKLKRKTITSKTISQWEKGASFPSYSQLETLAYKIYKRPLAVFFFSTPPDESNIEKSFRTLPQPTKSLSPRMRIMLRTARSMQLSIMELSEDKKIKPTKKQIFRDIKFTTTPSINPLVQKVRKYLGVTLAEQKNWDNMNSKQSSSDKSFNKWKKVFQSHGIFVFKKAFRDSCFSGFCLYDKKIPIIYVNGNRDKNRQIFTLFHELAHILFLTSGFDPIDKTYFKNQLKGNNKKIEAICNKFASAFLVY